MGIELPELLAPNLQIGIVPALTVPRILGESMREWTHGLFETLKVHSGKALGLSRLHCLWFMWLLQDFRNRKSRGWPCQRSPGDELEVALE